MLALTGAEADGWMPSHAYLGLDRLTEAVDRINDAAAAAGRDPACLRKIYNISALIGRESDQPFHGSVRQWTDQLTSTFTEQGMNGFVFRPADDHENQLALFAGEVVPAVRTALDRRPAVPPSLDPQGRATP